MKCKYCKQKIPFDHWITFDFKCSPCHYRLEELKREIARINRGKLNKISEEYWKKTLRGVKNER